MAHGKPEFRTGTFLQVWTTRVASGSGGSSHSGVGEGQPRIFCGGMVCASPSIPHLHRTVLTHTKTLFRESSCLPRAGLDQPEIFTKPIHAKKISVIRRTATEGNLFFKSPTQARRPFRINRIRASMGIIGTRNRGSRGTPVDHRA